LTQENYYCRMLSIMAIQIHTTKDQVADLSNIFGKLVYSPEGEQDLIVPAWLEFMLEHSTGENF